MDLDRTPPTIPIGAKKRGQARCFVLAQNGLIIFVRDANPMPLRSFLFKGSSTNSLSSSKRIAGASVTFVTLKAPRSYTHPPCRGHGRRKKTEAQYSVGGGWVADLRKSVLKEQKLERIRHNIVDSAFRHDINALILPCHTLQEAS